MKHELDRAEKERISRKIAATISGNCPGLGAIYLFGSFVTEQPFSDIDIGILMERPNRDALNIELELELQLGKRINYPVDVRILNGAPVPFSKTVIGSGKLIFDKNPNDRANFEALTLKKYFDFSHFRKRYLQDVLNAPI